MIVSLVYIAYRIYTNHGTIGFTVPDRIFSGLMLCAEIFFTLDGINSRATMKKSHQKNQRGGRILLDTGFAEQRSSQRRRAQTGEKVIAYVPSYNEPVGAMNANMMSAVRAVLHHGHGIVMLSDCSGKLYLKMGIFYAARKTRQVVARKMILEERIINSGIATGETAHYLSNTLSVEGTDLSDPECRHFTLRRIAEDDARPLNVREENVVDLGLMVANAYENGIAIDREFILASCAKLKIDPAKAALLSFSIPNKITSEERGTVIATSTGRILRGAELDPDQQAELLRAITEEFDIPDPRGLVSDIINHRDEINRMSRQPAGDYEFDTPAGRQAYYSVCRIIERIQAIDEKPTASLPQKVGRLADLHLRRAKKIRLNFGTLTEIGMEAAERISGLPALSRVIEAEIAASGAPLVLADEKCFEQRKEEIAGVLS